MFLQAESSYSDCLTAEVPEALLHASTASGDGNRSSSGNDGGRSEQQWIGHSKSLASSSFRTVSDKSSTAVSTLYTPGVTIPKGRHGLSAIDRVTGHSNTHVYHRRARLPDGKTVIVKVQSVGHGFAVISSPF